MTLQTFKLICQTAMIAYGLFGMITGRKMMSSPHTIYGAAWFIVGALS